MSALAAHLKPRIVAALEQQRAAFRSMLGECYWTLRVDNTGISGQAER